MRVSIRNVSKGFDRTPVLRDISLEIQDHELFFLLGPSGCGKTTLLRLLAGFYAPDAGELWFGERRMDETPPHRRNAGMVFQNYALWPHLTVAQNVAYGLEVRRVNAAERRQRVAEALAVVRMEDLAERSPNQLSGGQQQRVALARALVVRPDVLLLDEPLSNLDARLRLEMREEIRRIHDETRITTVYVTHDQKEALSMADRVAVLREGAVEQIGEPRDIYARPATRFVAEFVGETNWLEGRVAGAAGEHLDVETRAGRLVAANPGALSPGQPVWVGFRPEAVRMGSGTPNALTARVRLVTYLGEIEQYRLELADGTELKAFEQNPQARRRAGDTLAVHVRPENFFVLPVTGVHRTSRQTGGCPRAW
jgi:iron(III) transport system ATP-binding protein